MTFSSNKDMSMEAEYLTQSNERGLISHKSSKEAVI